MQLDRLGANLFGYLDRRFIRIDEQAHENPVFYEHFDRSFNKLPILDDIQPAFGCYFLAFFRDQANLVRHEVAGDLEHGIDTRALEI